MGDDNDLYGPIRPAEDHEQAMKGAKIEASDASNDTEKKMTRFPETGGTAAETKGTDKHRSDGRQTGHQSHDVKMEKFPPPPGVLCDPPPGPPPPPLLIPPLPPP